MSILCRHKDVSGFSLIQLQQRIRDREEKMSRLQASITDKPEPTPKKRRGWLDKFTIGFLIFAVMYLAAHIVVAMVR